MAIRVYKPTSPGRRNASVNLHEEVTKKTPEKSLLRPITKTGGRNHHGKITVRGRGGGAKRRYRLIDFKRKDRNGIDGKVVGIISIGDLVKAIIADQQEEIAQLGQYISG